MADEKRYVWLRLYEDFFTSKRIKKLRGLAGGDTYTIIYLKMQLKALKTEGYLYFDNVMNDFAEELALDIDENADDVRVTIQYLLSVGLLECSEDGEEFFLTFLPNLIGSESASAQRVRDYRKRKKVEKALHCNASVTDVLRGGNAEKEIDKEREKEINNTPLNPPKGKRGKKESNLILFDKIIEGNPTILSETVLAALREWMEYKDQRKDHYVEKGMKNLLNQIYNAQRDSGSEAVVECIRNSMASNYQGIILDRLKKTPSRKDSQSSLEEWAEKMKQERGET